MQQKINWHSDLFTWQKPYRVNLKSPLPIIHYYQNKRLQVKESQYLILTYSWTLTPILNWTYSVMTISSFNARLPVSDYPIARISVRDLITNLRRMLAAKFFCPSHDEDHEVAWTQNPMMHKYNSFFKN